MRLSTLLALLLFLAVPGQAQVADDIEALVQAYHDAHRFNGSVLVSDGGEVVWSGGVGVANAEWGVLNTADTRFRVGSVTKQFAAAIVLQLVEEGRIDLEAPITTYLPDYPAEVGDRVTVHHLLVHTSGIPNYTSLPSRPTFQREPHTPDELMGLTRDLPLDFEPGARWSYSNSGYVVLGAIIEAVAGEPFADVLQERLLDPLGMTASAYDDGATVYPRAASGYERGARGLRHADYLDTSVPYAAGMLLSTVEDLHTWSDALFAGRVFDEPETLALMNTPHATIPGASADVAYGYGVFVGTLDVGSRAVPVVQHGGGINGYVTGFWRLTDRDAVIAVASNTSDGSDDLVEGIVALLHGDEAPMPRMSALGVLREAFASGGVTAVEAAFETARAGDDLDVDEGTLNRLGYDLLGEGETEAAVAVFRLNVAAYPEAANPHDSLGEALLASGDREGSIASYQRALEIDPTFPSARAALANLGVETDEPAGADVPEAILERYVGRYEIQPGFVLEITRDGTQVFGQATGQPRVEMVARSETEFAVTVVDARVVFEAGDPAPALTLFQGGAQIRAPRVEG